MDRGDSSFLNLGGSVDWENELRIGDPQSPHDNSCASVALPSEMIGTYDNTGQGYTNNYASTAFSGNDFNSNNQSSMDYNQVPNNQPQGPQTHPCTENVNPAAVYKEFLRRPVPSSSSPATAKKHQRIAPRTPQSTSQQRSSDHSTRSRSSSQNFPRKQSVRDTTPDFRQQLEHKVKAIAGAMLEQELEQLRHEFDDMKQQMRDFRTKDGQMDNRVHACENFVQTVQQALVKGGESTMEDEEYMM